MINYFADSERSTPLNLAVARVIVSALLLGKLVSYEWAALTEWPVALNPTLYLFEPNWMPAALPALAAVAGVALVGVLVGYRLRASTFLAALLVALLSTVRFQYSNAHSSEGIWFLALILLLFGLYAEEDRLTVDELRRTGDWRLSTLTDHVESADRERYPVSALKWSLLLVAIFYFQSGLRKLLIAPLEWIQPESLGRYILIRSILPIEIPADRWMFVGEFLLDYPLLLSAAAIGTIVLEFGFLPAVLAKRRVDVFVLGLVGMHVAVLFSIGPNFTDLIVLLTVFAPWDRLQGWLQPDETLRVVYDENCYFCARSLSPFPYLDVSDTVEFYSQRTAPESLLDRDADFDSAMFAFRDGGADSAGESGNRRYRGYHAFRALLGHLGLVAPLAWLMRLPVVSGVGERVYGYIAANRSQVATCSVEESVESRGESVDGREESVEGE